MVDSTDSTDSSEVSTWDGMVDWLVESLVDQPVALIVELGPNTYISDDEDDEVVCVQIQVLADDVLLLRRSRTVLGHLLIADYSTGDLVLDRWHFDGHFEDCTDGYIFSRDAHLIANICVTWFRDNWGARSTDELGCSYRFPDELLPPDPDLDEID
ncbi:hypothetical protein [Rhodococcus marinonascens]|uniref:hypothetical protein n=1 Tax=Rhodococcus marinonascens TaxID=38311 RepID=UPI000934A8E4|nr:hypothetical protein [Rhodococcus marinonascens]